MGMWEAYFDESGDDGRSTEFAIGGYILTSENARLMEAEWSGMLRRYSVGAFHMVDVAHRRKEFEGWSTEQSGAITTEAIGLINRFTSLGTCRLINVRKMAIPHDLYSFCAAGLLFNVSEFVEGRDKGAELACFFESGHSSEPAAKREFREVQDNYAKGPLASAIIRFTPKRERAILQAADLLCWHASKWIKDKLAKARPPRKDFAHLVANSLHSFFYINVDKDKDGNSVINLVPADRNPTVPHWSRDRYLEIVFSDDPGSNQTLAEIHNNEFLTFDMSGLVQPPAQPSPVPGATKVGRNQPCPCGSGKKYKRCHGRIA